MSDSSKGENFFRILHRAEEAIANMEKQVVILFGLSEMEKSHVFDWISSEKAQQQSSSQKEQRLGHKSKAIRSSFKETAIAPSILSLDLHTNLLSIPFKGELSYMEIVGISYFWRRIFRHAEKFKFLLILSQSDLFSEDFMGIFQLFSQFCHSFDLNLQNQETKTNLINSIALLIVSPSHPELHQKHFTRMTEIIEQTSSQHYHKGIVVQIMEHLATTKRLAFLKAQSNNKNAFTDTLTFLNEHGWSFWNVRAFQAEFKRPFQCSIMKHSCKTYLFNSSHFYTKAIKQWIKDTSDFYLKIFELFKCLKDNWKKAQFNLSQNILPQIYDMKKYFQYVSIFMVKLRKYHIFEVKEIQKSAIDQQSSLSLTFMDGLKMIIAIFSQFMQTHPVDISLQQQLNIYQNCYLNLASSIHLFCRNQQEKNLIESVKLMLVRTFQTWRDLFLVDGKLQPEIMEVWRQRQRGYKAWNKDKQFYFLEEYFIQISPLVMNQIFKSSIQLEEYQSMFIEYSNLDNSFNDYEEEGRIRLAITERMIDLRVQQGAYQNEISAALSLLKIMKDIIELDRYRYIISNLLIGNEVDFQRASLMEIQRKTTGERIFETLTRFKQLLSNKEADIFGESHRFITISSLSYTQYLQSEDIEPYVQGSLALIEKTQKQIAIFEELAGNRQ